MKNKNSVYNCILVALLMAGLTIQLSAAAQPEKKAYVEKVYSISLSGNLNLMSSNSDIEILIWDQNQVKITGEMTYKDGNDKDTNKLLAAFKNVNATSSQNSLELNLNLIKSSISRMGLFKKVSSTTVILGDGEKISIDGNKIKTSYKLWIPGSLSITLDSKYGKVTIADTKGKVKIMLYNVDLTMGDFGSSGTFDLKYSTATVGNGGSSEFNLYNTKINTAEIGNVNINTKYSKLEIKKAQDVQVDSYNDTCIFGALNKINATAKYASFSIESGADDSSFDTYNVQVSGKDFKSLKISAKYSKFKTGNIGDLTIAQSYQNTFGFLKVNTVTCPESKYDTFDFEEIKTSAEFTEAYSSDLKIGKTGVSFSSFSGNFKYGKIYLKLDPSIQFNLNYNSTYGKMDIPGDRFKVKHISDKDGPKTTFEGTTDSNAKCRINLSTYSADCKIE